MLRKNKKPMARGEIAQELGIDAIRVSHAIQRLLKHHEVKAIELDRYQAKERYNCSRRIRLYYL